MLGVKVLKLIFYVHFYYHTRTGSITGVLVSVVTVRIHSSWGEAIIYLLILLPVILLNLFIDLCAIYLSLMWEQWKHSACRLQNDSEISSFIFRLKSMRRMLLSGLQNCQYINEFLKLKEKRHNKFYIHTVKKEGKGSRINFLCGIKVGIPTPNPIV